MSAREVGPRPRAHEIDTLAMREVPNLLPPSWVDRRLTSDYGVDIEVEPFNAGRSSGGLLLLQVKGVDRDLSESEPWRFPMKTNGLRYAELFVVPVLLVVRPVKRTNIGFRYIWLQEYIAVVLDEERPNWREQGSVTLHLPVDNHMPDPRNERRLLHISDHPKRMHEIAELARLAYEYQFYASGWDEGYIDLERLAKMDKFLDEALKLESLFGSNGWGWSRMLASLHMLPARPLIKKLLAGEEILASDIQGERIYWETAHFKKEWLLEALIHFKITSVGGKMLSIVAGANNVELRRMNWQRGDGHWF
ncbi:DUF4365 domain-containing protein [Micromonospora parva]|uniref:DUF4365 domain-containing protein n=1 Tax=Micromonospora parva TaxID=1464048 RepID=UPI0036530B9B